MNVQNKTTGGNVVTRGYLKAMSNPDCRLCDGTGTQWKGQGHRRRPIACKCARQNHKNNVVINCPDCGEQLDQTTCKCEKIKQRVDTYDVTCGKCNHVWLADISEFYNRFDGLRKDEVDHA